MKRPFPIMLLGFALCAAGCSMKPVAAGPAAVATLASISGSSATGDVHFMQLADGSVEVKVDITGASPGIHGFHVHDKGDCGDNGNAAGPHFNPAGMAHGSPSTMPHHAGDFGNLTFDSTGTVHHTFVTRSITVSAGTDTVVGHAIVLHENADDLVSQPAGNAGKRIACGVATLMDATDAMPPQH
jgi:Cu-Zn family superoxide dismutase